MSEDYIRELITTQFPEVNILEVRILKGRNKSVRLTVDTREGIPIDRCAEINRFLRRQLEEEGKLPEDYDLQVGSPGLSEPLQEAWQYSRHLGRQLRVIRSNNAERKGLLAAWTPQSIFLEQPHPEDKKKKAPRKVLESIRFSDIRKAFVEPSFT